METSSGSLSTTFVTAAAFATGGVLGYYLGRSSRSSSVDCRAVGLAQGYSSDSSSNIDILKEEDIRMAIVIREDLALTAAQIAEHSSRAVLGLFKKVYKQKITDLRRWESGNQKIIVLKSHDEAELTLIQQAARAYGIPTHTFTGSDGASRQRSVMAIGPAHINLLKELTGTLSKLALQ